MRKHKNTRGLSISGKVILALGSIAAVMIVTLVISMIDYSRMSRTVVEDIALDMESIEMPELPDSVTVMLSPFRNAVHERMLGRANDFHYGFYRSLIPAAVALGTGLLLIFLLMFFLTVYYVKPIYHMLDSLDDYERSGKKYNFTFEGDDQLEALNVGITELANENLELRARIKRLKEERNEH